MAVKILMILERKTRKRKNILVLMLENNDYLEYGKHMLKSGKLT